MSLKGIEKVERNERDSLPLPLLFCESWMFVKENTDRKKQDPEICIFNGLLGKQQGNSQANQSLENPGNLSNF